jgi:hypothetical protein
MSQEAAPTRSAARQRAPRRQGHRAQLTVPAHAWERAVQLAAEQGTTPNDVLAQLMLRGLDLVERERSVELVAESRISAYRARRGVSDGAGELPSPEEAEEQARALRRDLAGDA